MEPITNIRSRTVVLPSDNIDTDQIIPARFLTTTTREGLGAALFADWRYGPDGAARRRARSASPQTARRRVPRAWSWSGRAPG